MGTKSLILLIYIKDNSSFEDGINEADYEQRI